MSVVKLEKEVVINLPEDLNYSTDQESIGEGRLFVAVKEGEGEWEYSYASPFSAPQCILLRQELEYEMITNIAFMKMLGMKTSLSESGIREMLQNVITQLISGLGYKEIKEIRNDNKMVALYGTNYGNDHYMGFVVGKHLYTAQIWVNDIEDDQEREQRAEELIRCISPVERKSSVAKIEPETCKFGSWALKESEEKEPIEWVILDKQEDKVLLVSKCILELKEYDENDSSIWKNSSLRKWLNNVFLSEAFTDEEGDRILSTDITESGTRDKVFILSKDEIEKYLPTPRSRIVCRTPKTQNAYTQDSIAYFGGNESDYWLRTPAKKDAFVMFVDEKGKVHVSGYFVFNRKCGVRPAIWVKK